VVSFDSISHAWLLKFIEHRVKDRRVLRHIRKWLKAGVLEEGRRRATEVGTPQGGSISPLLANVYLHYVLDLWVSKWRKQEAQGDVIIVRYVDDFVLGFQHRWEAERFLEALCKRLGEFGLRLHEAKSRLVEFGRYAKSRRAARGEGKPETINFLGFTHICGSTEEGKYAVVRRTQRARMRRKLHEVHEELRKRMHHKIPEVGRWLGSVLRGHYQYYGVPFNRKALGAFRHHVIRLWYRTLCRRSQKGRILWARMERLAKRWLPLPRVQHPYPHQRLIV